MRVRYGEGERMRGRTGERRRQGQQGTVGEGEAVHKSKEKEHGQLTVIGK